MSGDKVTLRDIMEISEKTQKEISAIRREFREEIGTVKADVRQVQNFHNRALGVLSVVSLFTSALSTYLWNRVVGQ